VTDLAESVEVNVLGRRASKVAGRSNGKSVSPEIGNIESAEPVARRRRPAHATKELDICSGWALRGRRERHATKDR